MSRCKCHKQRGDELTCRECYPDGDPRVRSKAYMDLLRGLIEKGAKPTPEFTSAVARLLLACTLPTDIA